jgi:protease IV
MNFFKTFLASCLGSLVALIALTVLLFIVWIGIIGSIMSGVSNSEPTSVESRSILHLKLDAPIIETQSEDAIGGFPFGGNVQPIGLVQLKNVINHAKSDSKI